MVHQEDMTLKAYSIHQERTEDLAVRYRKHSFAEDKASEASESCSSVVVEAEKLEVSEALLFKVHAELK